MSVRQRISRQLLPIALTIADIPVYGMLIIDNQNDYAVVLFAMTIKLMLIYISIRFETGKP